MKATRFHAYGDPDVLVYEDVARPEPAPGHVLVEVAATSFNPIDAAIRAGFLRQVFPVELPHIPGIDVAGTIAELGEGVTGWRLGDRVIGFLPMVVDGASAEYVTVPADVLAPAPATIPLVAAAALPATAMTAQQALFEHAGLLAGQRVLINGAGGGVGGFAVQLAKGAGAFVIATAGPRSAEAVRDAGADQIVDYTVVAPADAVADPVDVVFNLVSASAEQMAALTGLVRPGGAVLSVAAPAIADPDRNVRALGMRLHADATQLTALVKKVDAGELRVRVTATRPLSQLAEVHEQAAAGRISGKILLTPDS